MANTGRKVYQFLKQVDAVSGTPTGLVKANSLGDPDYQPPVVDYITCPTVGWRASGPNCLTNSVCAPGYTLSPDGTQCQKEESMPSTPPSSIGGTPGTAAKLSNVGWNNGGGLLFNPGYALNGTGSLYASLTTPHFWVNGNFLWDSAGRNTTYGRMNAVGIWGLTAVPDNEWIGFSRKVTITTAKTYYVGIAGDNEVKIVVNGVKLVEMQLQLGGPNFNFWNVYPVDLFAGDNYIEVYGLNLGGAAGFGAEIYDNTAAQIAAATNVGGLNIIFSTLSVVGQAFNLGQTQGYSCPPGWSLDATGGGAPVCKKVDNLAPTLANTGMKAFATRDRITSGAPDGYTEANTNGGGLGPYFPPVLDTINCPT